MIFLCAVIFTIIKHIALHYTRIQSILNKIQVHQTDPTADNITNYEFQHIITPSNWKFKLLSLCGEKGLNDFIIHIHYQTNITTHIRSQRHRKSPLSLLCGIAAVSSIWRSTMEAVPSGFAAPKLGSQIWGHLGYDDGWVANWIAQWEHVSQPGVPPIVANLPTQRRESFRSSDKFPFRKGVAKGCYICFYMEGSLVISYPQVIISEHNL